MRNVNNECANIERVRLPSDSSLPDPSLSCLRQGKQKGRCDLAHHCVRVLYCKVVFQDVFFCLTVSELQSSHEDDR